MRLVERNLRFETLKSQYGFCRSQQGRHVFERSTYVDRRSVRVKVVRGSEMDTGYSKVPFQRVPDDIKEEHKKAELH
jgi:hypothetical protein